MAPRDPDSIWGTDRDVGVAQRRALPIDEVARTHWLIQVHAVRDERSILGAGAIAGPVRLQPQCDRDRGRPHVYARHDRAGLRFPTARARHPNSEGCGVRRQAVVGIHGPDCWVALRRATGGGARKSAHRRRDAKGTEHGFRHDGSMGLSRTCGFGGDSRVTLRPTTQEPIHEAHCHAGGLNGSAQHFLIRGGCDGAWVSAVLAGR